jgi:hypothetical protein
MKLLISVLSCKQPSFETLKEDGIKKTWGSTVYKDTEIVYYYGSNYETCIENNDEIFVNVPEAPFNISKKDIVFFSYILKKKKFDYMFRTNVSSYVNVEKLRTHLLNKPKERYFSALIGNLNGMPFASGSGYIITPDLLNLIVSNYQNYNYCLPDDVAISHFLQQHNIDIIPAKRQNFESVKDISYSSIEQDIYHFRCKSETVDGYRAEDVNMQHTLYNFFKNENTSNTN